jgi:hypothetical protein
MEKLFYGRYTAQLDKPVVMFVIGMRVNRLWDLRKWWLVATAMPRMLSELARKPGTGFLSVRTYLSGRVIMNIQFWESFDQLLAYAHDKTGEHFPAWAAFNRRIGTDGSVGIWHETYLVESGKFECIYANMPLFGLAAATAHVKAEGRLAAAKDRMAA